MPINFEYIDKLSKANSRISNSDMRLQQQYLNELKPIFEFQSQYKEVLSSIFEVQSQYKEVLSSISEYIQKIDQVLKPYQSFNKEVIRIISSIAETSKSLSIDKESAHVLSSIASASSAAFNSMAESYQHECFAPTDNENDYIIINEAPIKEFEIPDTIAIPIGNNRVRIKTDLFFAILSFIVATTFSLISCLSDNSSTQNEITAQALEEEQQQTELIKKILEEQQQQTELLYQIFDDIDTSNSSQKEYLEEIYSVLQAQSPVPQDSEVIPDSVPELTDNNPE